MIAHWVEEDMDKFYAALQEIKQVLESCPTEESTGSLKNNANPEMVVLIEQRARLADERTKIFERLQEIDACLAEIDSKLVERPTDMSPTCSEGVGCSSVRASASETAISGNIEQYV